MKPARLLYASSKSADMLYGAKLHVPDPFLYLEYSGKRYLVMSDLEFSRAKAQAKGCTVLPLSRYHAHLKRDGRKATLENLIEALLTEKGIRSVVVPRDFPAWLYQKLAGKHYSIRTADGAFFPERAVKSAAEIRRIEEAQRLNEGALELALGMLRDADVRKGALYLDGKPLTSERIRTGILHHFLDHEYSCPDGVIVSCGSHSALPHHQGSGQLYAAKPIILDIFPRGQDGYWADMTRTVVKGEAPERLRRMFDAVLAAQETALSLVREGVLGSSVHSAVLKALEESGFPTKPGKTGPQGMIHGTGHGLGLDIHEEPRLALAYAKEEPLVSGNVVSVEPGLYYPGFGGVRIEDIVLVQKGGCRNLTRAKKVLEL